MEKDKLVVFLLEENNKLSHNIGTNSDQPAATQPHTQQVMNCGLNPRDQMI